MNKKLKINKLLFLTVMLICSTQWLSAQDIIRSYVLPNDVTYDGTLSKIQKVGDKTYIPITATNTLNEYLEDIEIDSFQTEVVNFGERIVEIHITLARQSLQLRL